MARQPRPHPRRPDPALLLAVALGLIMAWALLARPSLPRLGDARLHAYRVAEYGRILRSGVPLPRWSPRLYLGYGYPLFHYYAPLTYLLANVFSLAVPGAAVFGLKAVLVGGFAAAGAGAYGLGRLLWGERPGAAAAGLVAAASFVTAPYIALIDVYVLGHLPEFVALTLAPGTLWALAAYARRPTRRALVRAALLGTGLLLAHNLQAAMLFALGAGWLLWAEGLLPLLARRRTPADAARLLLPLALAPLLASGFWVPLLAERSAVQLGNLIGGTGSYFDYRVHFPTAAELFGPSPPLDPAMINSDIHFNLGVAQWALAGLGVLGLIALLARAAEGRRRALGALPWLAAALVLPALTLPASDPVWQAVPMLQFLQFPWRLLGVAALALAAVGAFAGGWIGSLPGRARGAARGAALGATLAAVLALALPIFIPPTWEPIEATDALSVYRFELLGRQVGTTATGDFLPVGVFGVPGPHPQLSAGFEQGTAPDRVDHAALPAGATAAQTRARATDWTFSVDSPEGFALQLLAFWWPGWRAAVDGEPAAATSGELHGLINVAVPPGAHTVRVWLGLTPPRTAGLLVSLAGLAALALAAWRLPRTAPQGGEPPGRAAASAGEIAPAAAVLGLFVVVAALGAARGWFQPRSSGAVAVGAAHQQHATFEGGVDLVGFTLAAETVAPGETAEVTLYWRAREPVPADLSPFVHIGTGPHQRIGQSDRQHPGNSPTSTWPIGKFATDTHTVLIPADTPPGEYKLMVGLWDPAAEYRQRVLDWEGKEISDMVDLAVPLRVTPEGAGEG